MPWTWLHRLQPDDAQAIARYLNTTLTPVNNRIPAPLRYGVVETIVMKVARGLPTAQPQVLTFADGVFGQIRGGVPRESPQALLIGSQWLALAIGIVAFVFAAPPGSRFPRTIRGRWLAVLGIVGLLLVGLIGVALYGVPGLRIIPPEVLVTAASPEPLVLILQDSLHLSTRRSPSADATSTPSRHARCATGPTAPAVRRSAGNRWGRNITPDPDTGIGRWSDAQIARAIRSGVAADGRMLHWQGMIWDHLSNLDEEDVLVLISYLRTLPPVRRQIPAARPPAPDDCDVYTFWLERSLTPGCR